MDANMEEIIRRVSNEVLTRLFSALPADKFEDTGKLFVENLACALREERDRKSRLDLVETGKHLDKLGFFPGTSGNISIRNPDDTMLITPSGVSKGQLKPEDLIIMDFSGNVLCGEGRPSSEAKMHFFIYKARPDVNAIVHCHPPFTTGFAAAGISLDMPVLPEAILILGPVPVVPYATPGTWEVPESLRPYIDGGNSFLLANHGALTLGKSLEEAGHRMETLELFAKVIVIARLLGGEQLLSEEQLKKLGNV
ncbi:MAG: class II aldolase/adducin family protein [Candidatus Eremiobacteraeota bacterium]|nr:class II aldolase/adducin family protein [Candidatus Eremiobacteraeota bacterium]